LEASPNWPLHHLDAESRVLNAVEQMAKKFRYERGFINYITGSLIGNPVAMYIYGAGLLAMWNAWVETLGGSFVSATFSYFVTKYLPPTSLEQIVLQVTFGAFVAATKWYVFTPRQGNSGF
jgi:hypothetical protein